MILKKIISLVFVWVVIVLLSTSQAQMFSVESKKGPQPSRWNQSVYLTVAPSDFSYQGAEDVQFSNDYSFSSPVIGLRYEIPGFDVYVNLGGSLTGIDNHSFVNVGAQLYQPFRLVNTEKFNLYGPLHLHTDFTRVVSEFQKSGIDQFQQSMLAPGAGLMYSIRFSNSFRYVGGGSAEYGYSFSAGNTFIGQLLGLQSQHRITIDEVFGGIGLSLGYDFKFRRYDIEIDRYDYNLRSHHIYLGISF